MKQPESGSSDPPPEDGRGAEEVYAVAEVAELVARCRERIDRLADDHPELSIVRDDFEEVARHELDPLRELQSLLAATGEVFVSLKHLLNPTGLPLHMTDDGRVKTRVFQGVTTFLTDIRGFTELTRSVSEMWRLDIFDLLSYCYFPYLTEVLEGHGCHYLNYTGDGLLVLSQDRLDESGRVVLPSIDVAVLCAIDLTLVTSSIAEAWRKLGLTRPDGASHETGLGLAFGDVSVGDPFVPDHAYRGHCAEFDAIYRAEIARKAPHIHPSVDFSRRVRAIHALSPSINRASRLQDMDKLMPDHTCMMTAEDAERLCPPLRRRFREVGDMHLKGIGVVNVHATLRHEPVDVPALVEECLAYHANRP
jgi:class 3 adenylate cyclase